MPPNLTSIKLKYTAYLLALLLLYAAGLRLALFLASLSPEWLAGPIAFLYFLFGILGGFFYFGYLAAKKYETILTSLAHSEPARLKLAHALENWYLVNILLFILSSVAIALLSACPAVNLSPLYTPPLTGTFVLLLTLLPLPSRHCPTQKGLFPSLQTITLLTKLLVLPLVLISCFITRLLNIPPHPQLNKKELITLPKHPHLNTREGK